jgi:hypothetical protein
MAKHQFKTTNIKGKQYVEVNERIKFFRQDKAYEGYSLTSEIITLDDSECVILAKIHNSDNTLVATGLAQEFKSASRINATSYVENCETSAWGRALANLGIGIDTSIASSNEVSNAIKQQENPPQSIDDVFKQAIVHIEKSKSKNAAYERIMSKYGEKFSENQVSMLKGLL